MGAPSRFRPSTREPGERPARAKLLLVPSEGTLLVVAVGSAFVPYDTHWDQMSRSVLWCSGDPRTCGGCREGWPSALSYYLEVLQRPTLRRRVLAIPERAYCNSLIHRGPQRSLRGHEIACGRLRKGNRSPVSINDLGLALPVVAVPDTQDLGEYLARVFGLS